MTSDDVHAASSEQLALLRDAARAKARGDDAGSAKAATRDGGSERVAVVWPMLEVPHLDREFEYRIPAELADDVRFGVAVKVRFHGKRITGYVVGVRETPEFTGTLSPLLAVVSPVAVLTEHIWQVAHAVAARMGGTVSDVLRLAIPPRHARAEKALDERMAKASAAGRSMPEVAEAGNAGPDAASAVPAERDDEASAVTGGAAAHDGAAVADNEAAPGEALASCGGHASSSATSSGAVAADGPAPGDDMASTSHATSGAVAASAPAPLSAWRHYAGGLSLLTRLAAGENPRGSWDVAPGLFGPDAWPAAVADAAAAVRDSGRCTVVVVPDGRDVDRVAAACSARLGDDQVVTLTADMGPQARYTAFLKALRGLADVVVGTRAAMFAPVPDLGLVVWWDDADTLHVDPHAPYPHVGAVLETRADLAPAALLSAGAVPSVRVQAQVEAGVSVPVDPVERTSARVVVTGDDRSVERHGAAARARIPAEAWQGATRALQDGPVLVQVPRRGYIPTIACARCRTKSTCDVCHGPLGLDGEHSAPTCRWCGHVAHVLTCPECGSHEIRSLTIGAGRTAEELGRAFPGVPVRRSGAPDVLASVPDEPALVICTPGAEPVAENGYSAAILLDAWALLDRGGLDAGQRALTHWCAAAGLVRPASTGGVVYLAGVPRHVPFPAVEALVRWAPRWFAARELAERAEVMLPPATRMAELEGPRRAAARYAEALEKAAREHDVSVDVLGPLPLRRRHVFDRATPQRQATSSDDDESLVRFLARWNDPTDADVPTLLRALTASRSAAREPVVTVRLDPLLDGLA